MGKRHPERPKIKVLDVPTWANERWIGTVIDDSFIRTEPKFKRPGLYQLASRSSAKKITLISAW